VAITSAISWGRGFDVGGGGEFPAQPRPSGVLLHLGTHGAGQDLLVTHHGSSRLVTTC